MTKQLSIELLQQEFVKSTRLDKEKMLLLVERIKEAFRHIEESHRHKYDDLLAYLIKYLESVGDDDSIKEDMKSRIETKLSAPDYIQENNWNAPDDESYQSVGNSLIEIVNSAHLVGGKDFIPDILILFIQKLREHKPDLAKARLIYIQQRFQSFIDAHPGDGELKACYQEVIDNLKPAMD
jgi:hypothetical protein